MSQRTGLPVIKKNEGFSAKAYLCPAGIPTYGYGETKGVKLGMTITLQEAGRLLVIRYDYFESEVLKLVKVKLNENQLGALVSFAYNLGITALSGSTLLRALNDGDYERVPREFAKWTKAKVKGKTTILPGLVSRRTEEARLFITPVQPESNNPVNNQTKG